MLDTVFTEAVSRARLELPLEGSIEERLSAAMRGISFPLTKNALEQGGGTAESMRETLNTLVSNLGGVRPNSVAIALLGGVDVYARLVGGQVVMEDGRPKVVPGEGVTASELETAEARVFKCMVSAVAGKYVQAVEDARSRAFWERAGQLRALGLSVSSPQEAESSVPSPQETGHVEPTPAAVGDFCKRVEWLSRLYESMEVMERSPGQLHNIRRVLLEEKQKLMTQCVQLEGPMANVGPLRDGVDDLYRVLGSLEADNGVGDLLADNGQSRASTSGADRALVSDFQMREMRQSILDARTSLSVEMSQLTRLEREHDIGTSYQSCFGLLEKELETATNMMESTVDSERRQFVAGIVRAFVESSLESFQQEVGRLHRENNAPESVQGFFNQIYVGLCRFLSVLGIKTDVSRQDARHDLSERVITNEFHTRPLPEGEQLQGEPAGPQAFAAMKQTLFGGRATTGGAASSVQEAPEDPSSFSPSGPGASSSSTD